MNTLASLSADALSHTTSAPGKTISKDVPGNVSPVHEGFVSQAASSPWLQVLGRAYNVVHLAEGAFRVHKTGNTFSTTYYSRSIELELAQIANALDLCRNIADTADLAVDPNHASSGHDESPLGGPSVPSKHAAASTPVRFTNGLARKGDSFGAPSVSPAFASVPSAASLFSATSAGTCVSSIAPALPKTVLSRTPAALAQHYGVPPSPNSASLVATQHTHTPTSNALKFTKKRKSPSPPSPSCTKQKDNAAQRANPREKPKQYCVECLVTETPEWRRGPRGPRTLCNACGLRWAKKMKREREASRNKVAVSALLN